MSSSYFPRFELYSEIETFKLHATMADLGNSTAATRLDPFHVHKATYKKVGEHEIQAAILIPKEQKPGKHPLLVKFHGGLFVSLLLSHTMSCKAEIRAIDHG